jgi:hypothetical protein
MDSHLERELVRQDTSNQIRHVAWYFSHQMLLKGRHDSENAVSVNSPANQFARNGKARPSLDCVWMFFITCLL